MDDNVMRKYTTMPSEAKHYIQYDQGKQYNFIEYFNFNRQKLV